MPGDDIDVHMATKDVGECDCLHGMLEGKPYNIFCMKEPDYVMKIMSTYGTLTVKENKKESKQFFFNGGERVEKPSSI